MLAFLISRQGAIIIGGIALATLLVGSHIKAYQAGAASERQATLTRSVEVLRERNATDEEISRFNDLELCNALGGIWMPSDGSCQ